MEKLITIAGGGLAGLACALGLRKAGLPVEVHEAGAYPRHRVCGEFLCGVSPQTLAALGLTECLEDGAPLRAMAWFHRDRRVLWRTLPCSAVGISRHRLDHRMARRLIASGGIVRTHSRLPLESREGLLFCTGRPPVPGGWVGVKAYFKDLPLDADLEMHMGRNAYIGLSRIEDSQVNVCGLFPGDSLKNLPRQELWNHIAKAARLDRLHARLSAATIVPDSISAIAAFRPGYPRHPFAAAIGDAAVAIPPFTGNGMSMAIEGASLAVGSLTPYGRGRSSWSSALADLHARMEQNFSQRMRLALVMHPFLLHPLGQLALAWTARTGLLPWKSAFLHTR